MHHTNHTNHIIIKAKYLGLFVSYHSPVMSSSSATATTSRSPSPHTPEASDCAEPIAIQSDFDLTSGWYHNMDPIRPVQHWDMDTSYYTPSHKTEEDVMLRLDELLEQHAYDEYVCLILKTSNKLLHFHKFPITART